MNYRRTITFKSRPTASHEELSRLVAELMGWLNREFTNLERSQTAGPGGTLAGGGGGGSSGGGGFTPGLSLVVATVDETLSIANVGKIRFASNDGYVLKDEGGGTARLGLKGIPLSAGGTNADLTAAEGGVVFSTATGLAISEPQDLSWDPTGKILGVGNGKFQVDADGNLLTVRDVAYSWPELQGDADSVLTNDGAGNLLWVVPQPGFSSSGDENYIAKITGATSIGNSILYEDTGKIGVATAAPSLRFDIRGSNAKATTALESVFQFGSTDAVSPLVLLGEVQTHSNTSLRELRLSSDEGGTLRQLTLKGEKIILEYRNAVRLRAQSGFNTSLELMAVDNGSLGQIEFSNYTTGATKIRFITFTGGAAGVGIRLATTTGGGTLTQRFGFAIDGGLNLGTGSFLTTAPPADGILAQGKILIGATALGSATGRIVLVTGTTEANGISFGTGADRVALYRGAADQLNIDDDVNLASGKVFKINTVQVVGAQMVDARIDDTSDSGDATTDGIIAALQSMAQTHGLMVAT